MDAIAKTPETWDDYVREHTFTDNPYHNLRVLLNRMDTVAELQGAPDRTEYERQRSALSDVIDELAAKTKLRKRFRDV